MNELKLEAGKYYLSRSGHKVYIDHEVAGDHYIFKGHFGSYLANGRVWRNTECDSDLIAEYKEPAKPQPAAREPLIHFEQRIDHANGWDIEGIDPHDPTDEWSYLRNPIWDKDMQYRRMPEPAPLLPNDLRFIALGDQSMGASTISSDDLVAYGCKRALRIEFNPNTQELVSAAVVTL